MPFALSSSPQADSKKKQQLEKNQTTDSGTRLVNSFPIMSKRLLVDAFADLLRRLPDEASRSAALGAWKTGHNIESLIYPWGVNVQIMYDNVLIYATSICDMLILLILD